MAQTGKNHQPGKTQVPGQLLGYGLQYTRMLSLLVESDSNSVVSLEVFEDVGVNLSDHFKSGQRLSLQNRPTEVAVQD